MKEQATDQASLDYLKISEFRSLVDLAGMAFRIDGSRYLLHIVDPEGEEIPVFEGPRSAVIDYIVERDASLRTCAENARQQVFSRGIFQPIYSVDESIEIINTAFDAGYLPGDREQWEYWCRRVYAARPSEILKLIDRAERRKGWVVEWQSVEQVEKFVSDVEHKASRSRRQVTHMKEQTSNQGPLDFSGAGCKLILDHLREVIADGDQERYKWLLAWLAEAGQNPMMEEALDKPCGLMIRGGQAAGKSLIIDNVFSKVLGRASALVQDDEKGTSKVLGYEPRWTVLSVSKKHVGNFAYFDALMHEIENGGVEAFHAYLLNPALLEGIDLRNPFVVAKMEEAA